MRHRRLIDATGTSALGPGHRHAVCIAPLHPFLRDLGVLKIIMEAQAGHGQNDHDKGGSGIDDSPPDALKVTLSIGVHGEPDADEESSAYVGHMRAQ